MTGKDKKKTDSSTDVAIYSTFLTEAMLRLSTLVIGNVFLNKKDLTELGEKNHRLFHRIQDDKDLTDIGKTELLSRANSIVYIIDTILSEMEKVEKLSKLIRKQNKSKEHEEKDLNYLG